MAKHRMDATGSKTVDELREAVIKKFDARAVRLQDELEAMLKLLVFQREALQNQVMEGLGYKQLGIDLKTVQASKELSLAYTRLVEAQIKMNKSLKELAESATPEEEKETIRKWIRAQDNYARNDFLRHEVEWHNKQTRDGVQKMALPKDSTYVDEDSPSS